MALAKPGEQPGNGLADLVILAQDAWTGGWGQRAGAQQLGVVLQALLLVSLGPGPVEHKFAIGVGFDVQRDRRNQFVAPVDGQVHGLPAGIFRNSTVLFHGGKKAVVYQWVIASKPVPVSGRDVSNPFHHLSSQGLGLGHLWTAEEGTGRPVGSNWMCRLIKLDSMSVPGRNFKGFAGVEGHLSHAMCRSNGYTPTVIAL